MRYALLLNYPEAGDVGLSDEDLAAGRAAFDEYLKALNAAGVFVSTEILQPVAVSTTVTTRGGELLIQDGPFADTKEKLGGVFVIEVPDLDAALSWAERCPASQYGVVEVRPVAVTARGDEWITPS
jgi:hypothetical protein